MRNQRSSTQRAARGVSQSWTQLSSLDQPRFSAVSLTTGTKSWRISMKGERNTRRHLIVARERRHSSGLIGLTSYQNSRKRPRGLEEDVAGAGDVLGAPSRFASRVMATSVSERKHYMNFLIYLVLLDSGEFRFETDSFCSIKP